MQVFLLLLLGFNASKSLRVSASGSPSLRGAGTCPTEGPGRQGAHPGSEAFVASAPTRRVSPRASAAERAPARLRVRLRGACGRACSRWALVARRRPWGRPRWAAGAPRATRGREKRPRARRRRRWCGAPRWRCASSTPCWATSPSVSAGRGPAWGRGGRNRRGGRGLQPAPGSPRSRSLRVPACDPPRQGTLALRTSRLARPGIPSLPAVALRLETTSISDTLLPVPCHCPAPSPFAPPHPH